MHQDSNHPAPADCSPAGEPLHQQQGRTTARHLRSDSRAPASHDEQGSITTGEGGVPAFDRDAFLKRLQGLQCPKDDSRQEYDPFGNPLPPTPWWHDFLFELWREGVKTSDPTSVLLSLCRYLRREFYHGPLPWERSRERIRVKKQSRPDDCGELRTLGDIRRAEEELLIFFFD